MQERAERTRRAIVRATAELIADGGPEAAGLVSICRRAGVSRGALYHHFTHKEAVAAAVHDQARREVVTLIDEAFATTLSGPPDDAAVTALSRFATLLGEALRDRPTVRAGVRLDPGGSTDRARELRQEMLHAVRRRVAALLTPGPDAPSGAGADGSAHRSGDRPSGAGPDGARPNGARPDGQDLADLATAVLCGLESLGRTDATWWSPATSARIWRTLRPLFAPGSAGPAGTPYPSHGPDGYGTPYPSDQERFPRPGPRRP
ncbi:TetR family transcriptional regulator [Streptomyces sp. JNUCC 64]